MWQERCAVIFMMSSKLDFHQYLCYYTQTKTYYLSITDNVRQLGTWIPLPTKFSGTSNIGLQVTWTTSYRVKPDLRYDTGISVMLQMSWASYSEPGLSWLIEVLYYNLDLIVLDDKCVHYNTWQYDMIVERYTQLSCVVREHTCVHVYSNRSASQFTTTDIDLCIN